MTRKKVVIRKQGKFRVFISKILSRLLPQIEEKTEKEAEALQILQKTFRQLFEYSPPSDIKQLYSIFDQMEQTTPLIARAIDLYTASLTTDIWSDVPYLSSKNFQQHLRQAIRDVVKFGDGYLLFANTNTPYAQYVPAPAVEIVEEHLFRLVPLEYRKSNQVEVIGPDFPVNYIFSEIWRGKKGGILVTDLEGLQKKEGKKKQSEINRDVFIVRLYYKLRPPDYVYGAGILDGVIQAWMEYRAAIQSILFARLLTLPERYILLLKLPPRVDRVQAEQYREEIQTVFSQIWRTLEGAQGLDLARVPQMLAMSERVILPVWGNMDVEFRAIPTPGGLDTIEDALHLLDNIALGLGIPKALLKGEEENVETIKQSGSIFQSEIRAIQGAIEGHFAPVVRHFGGTIWQFSLEAGESVSLSDAIDSYQKLLDLGLDPKPAASISGLTKWGFDPSKHLLKGKEGEGGLGGPIGGFE